MKFDIEDLQKLSGLWGIYFKGKLIKAQIHSQYLSQFHMLSANENHRNSH